MQLGIVLVLLVNIRHVIIVCFWVPKLFASLDLLPIFGGPNHGKAFVDADIKSQVLLHSKSHVQNTLISIFYTKL